MTLIDIMYPERKTPYGQKLVDVNMQKILFLKIMGTNPDIIKPSSYTEDYFDTLKTLLEGCLKKEPSERPTSRQLLKVFEEFPSTKTPSVSGLMDDTKHQASMELTEPLNISQEKEIGFNFSKTVNSRVSITVSDLQINQGK